VAERKCVNCIGRLVYIHNKLRKIGGYPFIWEGVDPDAALMVVDDLKIETTKLRDERCITDETHSSIMRALDYIKERGEEAIRLRFEKRVEEAQRAEGRMRYIAGSLRNSVEDRVVDEVARRCVRG